NGLLAAAQVLGDRQQLSIIPSAPQRVKELLILSTDLRLRYGPRLAQWACQKTLVCGRAVGCDRRQGQAEQERGTVVQFAFGPDLAGVRKHDMLGDGQAEPGSAGFAGARLIDPV